MAATTSTDATSSRNVLGDPHLNHGTAFTPEERRALGLDGLLPPAVSSLEDQAERAYGQYRSQPGDLARNTYLTALRQRNAVLFYRLLADHLPEILPVVYDPVIADAIRHYSEEFRRPEGVYLSVDDVDRVERGLRNTGLGTDDVDLIVATDAEEILGMGDWGTNGMDIAVGKLSVYTAAAGIDPRRVVPVMLDAGTDNEALLDDRLYLGNRHRRVRGERYDALIDAYVETASRLFPNALLHWEDFGPSNARRILLRYGDRVCTFNDDLQGTGAITVAAVLACMNATSTRAADQRVVIFGSGTAGLGIADQLRAVMVADGLDEGEATRRFWCVDKQGLLVDDMPALRDFQQPYARPRAEVSRWRPDAAGAEISLADVVGHVHPTILVGTSTKGGAFTESIVRDMAAHVQRPLIFPLSNPTERIEAKPADVIRWTDGRALVGTGTPWPPVSYRGTEYAIGQANNALIYPGIGLGTIVARASRVTDGMLLSASRAIAGLVDASKPGAAVLPPVQNLRDMSATVAGAVVRQALSEGVARATVHDPESAVKRFMWQPVYQPVGLSR